MRNSCFIMKIYENISVSVENFL